MTPAPSYQIDDLRTVPQYLAEVVGWHHSEWLKGRAQNSQTQGKKSDFYSKDISEREHSLRAHLENSAIPTSFIAHSKKRPLGTVSIVNYQFSKEQIPRPWLTNLYVNELYRGRGLASCLLRHAMSYAEGLSLKELYLYTRGLESFYLKRGWQYSHPGIVQGQRVEVLKFSFDSPRE